MYTETQLYSAFENRTMFIQKMNALKNNSTHIQCNRKESFLYNHNYKAEKYRDFPHASDEILMQFWKVPN